MDYEHKTLLGPLLRISPLLDNMASFILDKKPTVCHRIQINNLYGSMQTEYKVIIDHLFVIIDKLIRGSTKTRDLLQWLGNLINLSHLRRGSHADFKNWLVMV